MYDQPFNSKWSNVNKSEHPNCLINRIAFELEFEKSEDTILKVDHKSCGRRFILTAKGKQITYFQIFILQTPLYSQ